MKKIALNKETVRKLTHNDLKGAIGGLVVPCKATVTVENSVAICPTLTCGCTDTCHACGQGPTRTGNC